MKQHDYHDGHLILKEGDPSGCVYQIISGEVEIFTELDGKTVVLGTVKAGEFLGEMGVIDGHPRSASARAKTQVTAMVLEKWEFLRLISEEPASAHRLIARLCERLRLVTSKLTEAIVSKEVWPHAMEDTASKGESGYLPTQDKIKSGMADLRLTLFPGSQSSIPYMSKEGVSVVKFPFCVGRLPKANEPRPAIPMDLSLPDSTPLRLSRRHFSLDRSREGYIVRDLGSTLGTEVDGEFLGEQFGRDYKDLRMGENIVTAGGLGSPFTFKVLLARP